VTLQEVEARLRRQPELDKLEADVVQALARAVMRILPADEGSQLRRPLEDNDGREVYHRLDG
jgi:hypothetical protein